MFTLEFFNEDGESVREGQFDCIAEAYDRIDNIGSRWIFYPNARILDEEGKVIETFMA